MCGSKRGNRVSRAFLTISRLGEISNSQGFWGEFHPNPKREGDDPRRIVDGPKWYPSRPKQEFPRSLLLLVELQHV
jgi:hypothetical protein